MSPDLPTVQFLIACIMQKRRGKASSILSCEWHFVYLGRQRGGGFIDRNNTFRAHIPCFKTGATWFLFETPALEAEPKIRPQARFFFVLFFFHQWPLPPSVVVQQPKRPSGRGVFPPPAQSVVVPIAHTRVVRSYVLFVLDIHAEYSSTCIYTTLWQ